MLQESRSPPGGRLSDSWIALLIGLLALFVFNANGRLISAVDTYAARHLPFSVLTSGDVTLDRISDSVLQGRQPTFVDPDHATGFWVRQGGSGHLVSLYPVVLPVLVSPLYAVPLMLTWGETRSAANQDHLARILEKLTASLIAAGSVALLYAVLRRHCRRSDAVVLALLYAFGTNTWTIGSQALWQHGMAELLMTVSLWLLTGPVSSWKVAALGAVCVLLAGNRQPDAIFALAFGLYALGWAGRRWPLIAVGAAIPAMLLLAYNLLIVGHIAGAYGQLADTARLSGDWALGLAGLLFSPTRGLFVYTPFLLLLPLLAIRLFRPSATRKLALLLLAAAIIQVAGYASVDWRQGMSFGPRWLTDMVPVLVWLIGVSLPQPGRAWRAALVLLGMVSIGIQAIGAFWYTGETDAELATSSSPRDMSAYWNPANAAFLTELGHPPATPDLLTRINGNIDAADVDFRLVRADDGTTVARLEAEIAGWALADGRSPNGVQAWLGGKDIGGTQVMTPRPDVAAAMGSHAPAGFSIRFPVEDLDPGRYTATVLVRPFADSEPRLLGTVDLDIPADIPPPSLAVPLARAAKDAAGTLAQRLQPEGYWFTRHTTATSYLEPKTEMNVFLNAIMLDALNPIAGRFGLATSLEQAKTFLSKQIEPDGLVRFHGLPDAPTIGRLGCAITPDSDDTALAWRLAPVPDGTALSRALATLSEYRRADGLYRTWLAPRADYRCIDPGADPNPADIGIQMHLGMFLRDVDPAAAASLCRALQAKANSEALWVYYRVAPLVVRWRLPELERLGCRLDVSPARLQSAVPGQQVWLDLVGLLGGETSDRDSQRHDQAVELLATLARDHFAAVSSAPPLIYHNDLTAKVSRYYWSEEFGFALWLRLFSQTFPGATCGEADGGGSCASP